MNNASKQRQAIPVITYDVSDVEPVTPVVSTERGPRNLPPLPFVAEAVAHELEQLAAYLTKMVHDDETLAASGKSLGRNDMHAALAQRLGTLLGSLEVAARNIQHQASLLTEAK